MLSYAAFDAAVQRAADRAIAAHCSSPAGMCEACESRPAMREDVFCRSCVESDPRLRAAYFGESFA